MGRGDDDNDDDTRFIEYTNEPSGDVDWFWVTIEWLEGRVTWLAWYAVSTVQLLRHEKEERNHEVKQSFFLFKLFTKIEIDSIANSESCCTNTHKQVHIKKVYDTTSLTKVFVMSRKKRKKKICLGLIASHPPSPPKKNTVCLLSVNDFDSTPYQHWNL